MKVELNYRKLRNWRSPGVLKNFLVAGGVGLFLLLGRGPVLGQSSMSADNDLRNVPKQILIDTAVRQNGIWVGKVLDARTGVPVVGASIYLDGFSQEWLTDGEGRFSIKLEKSWRGKVLISLVGYRSKELSSSEVVLGKESTVYFLEPNDQSLSEVVVVGYAKQDRKTLTSAVAAVKGEDIQGIAAAGFDQLLQGKASGVLSSANSPVPGSGVFIRIRGTTSINAANDPLYVVDGVFINNRSLQNVTTGGQQTSPLADLNPADIESIEILKDANATAIYGSRGANGVILITTKRGTARQRAKIQLGYYYGQGSAVKRWTPLSGPEEALLQNETWINDGRPFAQRPYRPRSEGGLGTPEEQPTIDRIGLIFRQAPMHNADLSLLGGNEKTSFYVGANFFSQTSVVRPDYFKRYSTRLNLDHQFSTALKIGVSLNAVVTDRRKTPNNNVPWGIVNGALYTPSNLPLLNEDGSYARPSLFENPLAGIREIRFTDVGNRLLGNAYLEWTIAKGLVLKSSWSIDQNQAKEDNYYNSKTFNGQAPTNGQATSSFSQNRTLLAEQILSYSKRISKHQLDFLLGNTVQKETFEQTSVTGVGFPTDEFSRISSAAVQTGSSSFTDAALLSYFSRVGYVFDRKYAVDLNVRADASSRFGRNNRWGYFPSAGVSWRAGEEEFIKNLGWFSDLKFKGSIGTTGNQNGIPDFAARGLWSGGGTYLDGAGIQPSQLANPELKWESTTQFNVGVDFSFFQRRLQFEINYYDKYTRNLLLQMPISSQLGFSSIFSNSGEISNKGFEFSVQADIIERENFSWRSSFNIATNKNRIEKLPAQILRSTVFLLREGIPLYSFYTHRQLGVDPNNGEVLFEDVNKDGRLSDADLQVLGNAWPDFFGGWDHHFKFLKAFDVRLSASYSIGNDIWNNTRYRMGHGGSRNGVFAMLKEQLNRWQSPGDITDVPRMTASGNNAAIIPSRFIEDGSFLRLRSFSVGYELPKSFLQNKKIQYARIYLAATNLLTLTRYSGVDPEVNVSNGDQNVLGYDQAIAPQPRTIQVGFQLTF